MNDQNMPKNINDQKSKKAKNQIPKTKKPNTKVQKPKTKKGKT